MPDARDSLTQPPWQHWLTDSKDLFDNLQKEGSPSCSERRLALDLVVLRELLARPCDTLHWIDTAAMLADGLTKSMQNHFLRQCMSEGRHCWQFDETTRNERKSAKALARSRTKADALFTVTPAHVVVRSPFAKRVSFCLPKNRSGPVQRDGSGWNPDISTRPQRKRAV